jgi:hypothetical protein
VAQFAYLEVRPPGDEHSGARKALILKGATACEPGSQAQVTIDDLTDRGLLLEGALSLSEGEELEVIMPREGTRRVKVAWAGGRFFGCRFVEDVAATPPAPAGMDALPNKGSPEAVSLAAVQLHDLSLAIERISRVLDRAMDQLSKRDR